MIEINKKYRSYIAWTASIVMILFTLLLVSFVMFDWFENADAKQDERTICTKKGICLQYNFTERPSPEFSSYLITVEDAINDKLKLNYITCNDEFSIQCYPSTDGYSPFWLKKPIVKQTCEDAVNHGVLFNFCKTKWGTL